MSDQTNVQSQENRPLGWYIQDSFSGLVHRGPYKHCETADAVRAEMERNASDEKNAQWKLHILEVKVRT